MAHYKRTTISTSELIHLAGSLSTDGCRCWLGLEWPAPFTAMHLSARSHKCLSYPYVMHLVSVCVSVWFVYVCVCGLVQISLLTDWGGGEERGAMRDDSAEILFHLFLLEATVSSSGIGRDVYSLILSSPLDTHRGCWPIMVQPPWPPQRCWP